MSKPNPILCREWQQHPVTKWLLEDLDRAIDEFGQKFIEGYFNKETEFETLKATFKANGAIEALDSIADLLENVSLEEESE